MSVVTKFLVRTFVNVILAVLPDEAVGALTRVAESRLITARAAVLTDSRPNFALVGVDVASVTFTCGWTVTVKRSHRVSAVAAIAEIWNQAFVDVNITLVSFIERGALTFIGVHFVKTCYGM